VQALIEERLGTPLISLLVQFIKPALLPGQAWLDVEGKWFRLLSNSQVILAGIFET
jgi:hypothetical protein